MLCVMEGDAGGFGRIPSSDRERVRVRVRGRVTQTPVSDLCSFRYDQERFMHTDRSSQWYGSRACVMKTRKMMSHALRRWGTLDDTTSG